MRVTMHSSRTDKKNKVYATKHNDRNFDTTEDEHIHDKKSSQNWLWHCYKKTDKDLTFDEVEQRFYETHFAKSLEAKNNRYMKQRHKEKVKSIEQYRKSAKSCPEEVIYQIGKVDETVNPKLLQKIIIDQVSWEMKTFKNVKILDTALHVDEDAAPHLHLRKVWIANTADGLTVNQSKALKAMKIDRLDMSKAESRTNNAKQTYTKLCREHFIDLCKQYNLEIETTAKEASKTGLDLIEYKRRQEEKKVATVKQQYKQVFNKMQQLEQQNKQLSQRNNSLNAHISDLTAKNDLLEKTIVETQKRLETANMKLTDTNKQIEEEQKKIQDIQKQQQEALQKLDKLHNSDDYTKFALAYMRQHHYTDDCLNAYNHYLDAQYSSLVTSNQKSSYDFNL